MLLSLRRRGQLFSCVFDWLLPMAISSRQLKNRRERLGLTQAELARRMGVTWNTVARWETAQRRIPQMAAILLGYLDEQGERPSPKRKPRNLARRKK